MKNAINVKNYFLGNNALNELPGLLEKKMSENGIVIFAIDDFFQDKDIIASLPVRANDEVIFINTESEPHADYIDELVLYIKDTKNSGDIVAVVGMGGGTTMDIAKAIAVLLTNDGSAVDYQGWDLVKNPSVYSVGIPTLAGTGAEVSRTAVLTSRIRKLGINSDYSIFDQVILDPLLLKTVPKNQFIYTGMDNYVHCVESLSGRDNNAMTIAFADKSLALLREIFLGEMDYEKLMVASAFGGMAIANSNVGICHPLSYGLSLIKGFHHGYAICLAFNQLEEYYPEVVEFQDILKKMNFNLPSNVLEGTSDKEFEMMADATLLNNIPLSNAFGENWKELFPKEKVIELLRKI